MTKTFIPCSLILFLGFSPLFAAEESKQALVHCRVFNGYSEQILADATVLLQGNHIQRIADSTETLPDGYASTDCGGYYKS